MNAIVALKKAIAHANSLSLGLASITVEGMDIVITPTSGSPSRITIPTPKDGNSITNVAINDNNELVCTLSDGTEINAGQVPAGEDGDSAYEVAVENGFTGTEQEWLDSLAGVSDYNDLSNLPLSLDENGDVVVSEAYKEFFDSSGAGVDMSSYYTKNETDAAIKQTLEDSVMSDTEIEDLYNSL